MAVKKKKTAPKAKKPAKKVAAKAKKPAAKKTTAKPAAKKKVSKPKAKPAAAKKKTIITPKTVKKTTISMTNKKKGSVEKTRYSDKELQEFKKLIMDKLEASRKELKYLHEQINRTDDSDHKFTGLEDGTGTSEKEYLSQMASRQITYIDHLEKALVRIANKTYGVCRVTGKLIGKERLMAVPHATLSIEAKKMQSA